MLWISQLETILDQGLWQSAPRVGMIQGNDNLLEIFLNFRRSEEHTSELRKMRWSELEGRECIPEVRNSTYTGPGAGLEKI